MVGGGSLFLSLPSLLGLKEKYPQARIELVATPSAAKFAELMGIFDRIHVVKDSSAWFLVGTTFKAAQTCWGADAVLNYEVYSQFSKLFVMFLFCRIRIGFYMGAVGHSAYIYSHSVYWNIAGCVVRFYEQAVKCLGAESCSDADARRHFRQIVGLPQDRELHSDVKRIALGVGCSGYFPERMLSPEQWQYLIHVESGGADIVFVGGEPDRLFAESIIALSSEREKSRLINLCGQTSLREAVEQIDACDEYWGIDSGLLHMSIGLGVPVKSFWGPSAPHTRLSGEMSKLGEFRYAQVPCSPCVHMAPMAPCRGNNQCIKALFPRLVGSMLPSYTPVQTVTDDVYTWMRHLWAHLKQKSFIWVLALLLCCITAFLGYRTIPTGGISDRTSWLDYGSEQQAWGDAVAISNGWHRWGIVQYAHYPNGPSYVLLPWMAITGQHDPDTMRMLPFWLALVAQYFLYGACIKAFRSRTLAALAILGIACMQIQPGMYEWMSALHQHSYVMTVLLLMLGASLIMPRVGLLFCVAGLLAGWLGYDMLLLIAFSAGAVRFLYHATIAESDRWIWRTTCDIGFFLTGIAAAVGLHLVQNSLFFGSVNVAFLDLLGSAATRAGHEVGKEMNPAYYSWISGETNKSLASFGNAFPAMLRTWLDKPWAWPLITKAVLLATLLWTLGSISVQRHRSWLEIAGLYVLFVGILCIGAVAWPFVMPWHFVHHFHFIPRHYYGVAIAFILGSFYLCDYSFSSQRDGVVPNKVSTVRLLGQSALVTLALLGFMVSAIARP